MRKALVLFMVIAAVCRISGEGSTINWNAANNFGGNILRSDNVVLKYEGNVPLYYTISQNMVKPDKNTDIYLDFDTPLKDTEGNYRVIYRKYHVSESKSVNKKSAYFIGADEKIELAGNDASFFQSGTNLGSFTISFWVYPADFAEDQTMLKIGSQYYDKSTDSLDDQSITAKIINTRLVWEFKNVFFNGDNRIGMIRLKSFSRLMPEKWSNVSLIYDSFRGIITAYINNNEEGMAVTAENNDIDMTKYNLRFNPQNRCIMMLAPDFYGALDEFYISSEPVQTDIDRYSARGGEILSRVVDFGSGGINIGNIRFEDYKEKNSDVVYYYRYSSKPFDPDDAYSSDVKWNRAGENFAVNRDVRFFQWKALLYAGTENNYSPRLKGIEISYRKNNPPAVPAGIKVLPCDGSIDIKWLPNSEKSVKGYKIYYGFKSGSYFGRDASEGASPVDAGPVTRYKLTGLDTHRIYYIAITAYDDEGHTHESDFSKEIIARPLGICSE